MNSANTNSHEQARAEILGRLAVSREELRLILDPPPPQPGDAGAERGDGGEWVPRSRTMQMLMGGRGLRTVGALAAGLLVARPALALRLLRMLPAGALSKAVLMRVISSLRERKREAG
jgi:hypothetical protein